MLNVIFIAFILQIYSVFCYFTNFLEFFFCYAHDFSYLCRIICVAARTMERKEFELYLKKYEGKIEQIRQSAHDLHQSVNQTYGDELPYGYHLDMVVNGIRDFGDLVCVREEDVLPLFFGGYYHDSIEDARLTYNDVMKVARGFLTEEQALLALIYDNDILRTVPVNSIIEGQTELFAEYDYMYFFAFEFHNDL